MFKKITGLISYLEKHGLVNKVLDKVLTPEMAGAIAEGFARGLVQEAKKK